MDYRMVKENLNGKIKKYMKDNFKTESHMETGHSLFQKVNQQLGVGRKV